MKSTLTFFASSECGYDPVVDQCIHSLSASLAPFFNIKIVTCSDQLDSALTLFICSKDLPILSLIPYTCLPKLVICDPKVTSCLELRYLRITAAYIVSSFEQESAWSWTNIPCYILPMFTPTHIISSSSSTDIPLPPPTKPFAIYHGNRVHLENFFQNYRSSLRTLVQYINFALVYNFEILGRVRPETYKIDPSSFFHYQFSHSSLRKLSAAAAFGIVPTLLPSNSHFIPDIFNLRPLHFQHAFEFFDHIMRFKSSSNAGRCHLFASQNLPVVAEASPSISSIIHHRYSGFLFLNHNDLISATNAALQLTTNSKAIFSSRVLEAFQKQFLLTTEHLSRQFDTNSNPVDLIKTHVPRRQILLKYLCILLNRVYLRPNSYLYLSRAFHAKFFLALKPFFFSRSDPSYLP